MCRVCHTSSGWFASSHASSCRVSLGFAPLADNASSCLFTFSVSPLTDACVHHEKTPFQRTRRVFTVRLLLLFAILSVLLLFPPPGFGCCFTLGKLGLHGQLIFCAPLVFTARLLKSRRLIGDALSSPTRRDRGSARKNVPSGIVPHHAHRKLRCSDEEKPPCACVSTFFVPRPGNAQEKGAENASAAGPEERVDTRNSCSHTPSTSAVSCSSRLSSLRLDIVLSKYLGISRTLATAHFIRGERVWIDDKLCVSPGQRVKVHSKVSFLLACVCGKKNGLHWSANEEAREETGCLRAEEAASPLLGVPQPRGRQVDEELGVSNCRSAGDPPGNQHSLAVTFNGEKRGAVEGAEKENVCDGRNARQTDGVNDPAEVAALPRCRLRELPPKLSQHGQAKRRRNGKKVAEKETSADGSGDSSKWECLASWEKVPCTSPGEDPVGLSNELKSRGADAAISYAVAATAASSCQGSVLASGGNIEENPLEPSPVLQESSPLLVFPDKRGLQILYEDRDIVIVNKPAGLLTHPPVLNLRSKYGQVP